MGQISVEPGMSAGGHRRFSLEFRVEFLRAWDGRVERGAKTRLLREYGLDRNTVYAWVRARDNGELEQSQQRVASRSDVGQMRAELARLRAENETLRRKTAQAEAATEILGKAFELLEGITTSSEPDSQIPPALMSATEYASWLKRLKLS